MVITNELVVGREEFHHAMLADQTQDVIQPMIIEMGRRAFDEAMTLEFNKEYRMKWNVGYTNLEEINSVKFKMILEYEKEDDAYLWIECEDRLPKTNSIGISDPVLLCWSDGIITIGIYDRGRNRFDDTRLFTKDGKENEIIAWRKLPDPYRRIS